MVFALYFMFCTINGAFSFGLRMFLMNVHEMEPHDTLITSLVFNGGYGCCCVFSVGSC